MQSGDVLYRDVFAGVTPMALCLAHMSPAVPGVLVALCYAWHVAGAAKPYLAEVARNTAADHLAPVSRRPALRLRSGHPERCRAVAPRAADRRLVWPVCTHEMDASFRDSLRRRSARSRLHRRPARRRTPPPPNIRWTMLPEGS